MDIDDNTVMSLEAIQTSDRTTLQERKQSLIGHYAQLIVERKDTLAALSDFIVADSYFAKKPFVDALQDYTD